MQSRKEKTSKAIDEISRVFKFELWLRFYFIQDKDGRLTINIDDPVLQKFEQEYGHLAELAYSLNHKEITPELCRKVIVEHIMEQFDETDNEADFVPKILDHKIFKTEIQLFNTWVALCENQLDQKVLDFEKWLKLFDEWKTSESAQKIITTINIQDEHHYHPGSQKTN